MKVGQQTTLRVDASVTGIGVHSGLPATLTLHPADANTGIVFVRTGLEGRPDREIRANVRAVTATEFATVLGDPSGPLCSSSRSCAICFDRFAAAASHAAPGHAAVSRRRI